MSDTPNIEKIAADIMAQAQVFASAWSIVGGQFDAGHALTEAEHAKSELSCMVKALAALAATSPADAAPATSPTAGMSIAQRILHVGGRNNAAGYVEFGSLQAVEALVRQVFRDLPESAPAQPPSEHQADIDQYSEQLTRSKNLLVRIWNKHPEARAMIEGATGSWFVWGQNRDAVEAEKPAAPAQPTSTDIAQLACDLWVMAQDRPGNGFGYAVGAIEDRLRAALAAQPVAVQAPDGMPASSDERHLRRLLAARVGMPGLYLDDGEASGQEHGIFIDFMRDPVADIAAKLRALGLARYGAAPQAAPEPLSPLTDAQLEALLKEVSEGIEDLCLVRGQIVARAVERAHRIGTTGSAK